MTLAELLAFPKTPRKLALLPIMMGGMSGLKNGTNFLRAL
jgi:hypothetical protein